MIHLIFPFIGLLMILAYNYISKTLSSSFLYPTLISIGFSSLLISLYKKHTTKRETLLSDTLTQREKIMEILGYKTAPYFFSFILATTDYFLLYFMKYFLFGCSHVLVIIFIFIVYGLLISSYQNLFQILKIFVLLFIYNLTAISLLSEHNPSLQYFILQYTDIYTYHLGGLFKSRVILIIILMIVLFRKILLYDFEKKYRYKLCRSAIIGQIDAKTFCSGIFKTCPLLNINVYGICMILYGFCNFLGCEEGNILLRQSFSLLLVEILYFSLVFATTFILLSYTYMSVLFYEFGIATYLIKFFPSDLEISMADRSVSIQVPFYNFGSSFVLSEAYGFLWAALYILHLFIVIIFKLSYLSDSKFNMGHVIERFSKERGLELWKKIFVINQTDITNIHINVLYFGTSLILFIFCRSVSKSC